MPFSQSEDSEKEQDDSPDFQRLHSIWKYIKRGKEEAQGKMTDQSAKQPKETKWDEPKDPSKRTSKEKHEDRQSSHRSVNSMNKAIHKEQQRNLETRLVLTEKQLSKARENTALLMKKLSDAEEKIEYAEYELQNELKRSKEKDQLIEELRNRRMQEREDTFGKEKLQNSRGQEADDAMAKMKRRLDGKQKQIDRLTLKVRSLELEKKKKDDQIIGIEEANEQLVRKLADAQNALNEVYLGEQSRGAQLLELDEANAAVQRLVLLLKNTEEYHKFGTFAEETKEIHFLKNITKRLKNNLLNYTLPQRKRLCSCTELCIDERLLWTPAACYKTVLDMKLKYQSLSEECIEQMLFELNKLWLAKEESVLARCRLTYEGEIARLKRKTEERYDEMVARKQIQRLKKELTDVKVLKSQPRGQNNLQTLKSIGQYEDQLRLKQKEIKLLQERIKLMETENHNYDKVLYLQGALWIIDKVLQDIGSSNQEIQMFEARFREGAQQMETAEDWLAVFKEFFETIAQINNSLVEKLEVMKESTLKKMGNQRAQLKSSFVGNGNSKH